MVYHHLVRENCHLGYPPFSQTHLDPSSPFHKILAAARDVNVLHKMPLPAHVEWGAGMGPKNLAPTPLAKVKGMEMV